MQISKAQHDNWVETIQDLTNKEGEARAIARDQRNQINNFNEILDKVVRAATGQPIIQHRDLTAQAMGVNYGSHEHHCTPPTEVEELRSELALARAVNVTLESQLSAAVAVATFAKEHKA